MPIKLPLSIRNFLKATSFWQDNYLILREFQKFKRLAILAVVLSLFAAAFEGFGLGFLLAFLQSLTTPNAPPIKTGNDWFDLTILGINASANERLYRVSALIVVITCIRALLNYFGQICTQFSEINLINNLRRQIFEQLQSQSLSYFAKKKSGELIDILTTEMERIRQIFGSFAFLITRGLTLVVYCVSLFLLSWQLSTVSILLFGLVAVGLSTLNKRIREFSFGISLANADFTSNALEFLNGIRTVHAFATHDFERKRYYKASFGVLKAWEKVYWISLLVKPLAESLSTAILVMMIIVGLSTGLMQIASLLTFFFVLFRVVPMTQDMNGTLAFLSTQGGAVDNIKELLRSDDKIYFQNGSISFPGLKRSIDIVSVDFGYDSNNLVLHDITLTIEQGKMTALVGGSGAGKSTLADLIPRFSDPIAGNVLMDGVDVQELEIKSLRDKMAVVSQDTFIFNASIKDNITYGTSGASEAEIREAANQANALEFIEKMPQGFETKLGDRGAGLSGGQKQRIAIARALLRKPEILILDEATSGLDSVSELLIQQSLEKLSVGRTVIAIAHRLSTIARADKVVVLEKGRIVEQGKYQELLERRGLLWKFHKTQFEIGKAE